MQGGFLHPPACRLTWTAFIGRASTPQLNLSSRKLEKYRNWPPIEARLRQLLDARPRPAFLIREKNWVILHTEKPPFRTQQFLNPPFREIIVNLYQIAYEPPRGNIMFIGVEHQGTPPPPSCPASVTDRMTSSSSPTVAGGVTAPRLSFLSPLATALSSSLVRLLPCGAHGRANYVFLIHLAWGYRRRRRFGTSENRPPPRPRR